MSTDGHEPAAPPPRGWAGRIASFVTTLVVVGGIVALGYWGHATDWRFGKKPATPPSHDAQIAVRVDGKSITFASAEAAEVAGIDIAVAWEQPMTDAVTAGGELRFDPNRTARLAARVSGSAWRVVKTIGDPVAAGETVAVIDAAEVGRAKAELQVALVQVAVRQKTATDLRAAGRVISVQERQEAEASLKEAEVRLLGAQQAMANLGLPVKPDEYAGLTPDQVAARLQRLGLPDEWTNAADLPGTLWPLRCPIPGVVLQSDVIAGEVIDPTKTLFAVADGRQLWLTLHLRADDLRSVRIGQAVTFRPDGATADVSGKVEWIGTTTDETTRTIPVRAAIDNADGRLRAYTFGRGRVILRQTPNAVVVPADAVRSLGGQPVVFVRDPDFLKPDGAKSFHVRPVVVGATDGPATELRSGLRPGEVIATKGVSWLLDEVRRAGTTPEGGSR